MKSWRFHFGFYVLLPMGCNIPPTHGNINLLALKAICVQIYVIVLITEALRRLNKMSNCVHIVTEHVWEYKELSFLCFQLLQLGKLSAESRIMFISGNWFWEEGGWIKSRTYWLCCNFRRGNRCSFIVMSYYLDRCSFFF